MIHTRAAVVVIWIVAASVLGPLVGRRLKNRQPTDSNDNTNGGSR